MSNILMIFSLFSLLLKNWLEVGNKNRATASTGMNEKSSRSHSVFIIILTQVSVSVISLMFRNINPILGRGGGGGFNHAVTLLWIFPEV